LEWGGNEEGMGRGRSVYEQPGARVDEDAPCKEEGFQVSKRDLREKGVSKGNLQGELARGIKTKLCHVPDNVNPVYIVLLCVCCANKRIVFRLEINHVYEEQVTCV
jgi:hypothetical protein